MSERIVILGAGIAGISTCERILKEAPGTEILMISGEQELPYVRPLLSKLALSTFRRESLAIHGADWYGENNVRLMTGTFADRLLTDKKEVLLADGTAIPYEKCIYALGARCHVPPIPGADLPGTACVRTKKDLQKIRRLLAVAKRAVVIGGGVIGLEFSWEIRRMGCEVTVLEALPHLMPRVLDPQSAALLEDRCAACGIEVCTGAEIERIEGSDRAEAVVLAGGRRLEADLVLLSCGVRSNTAVAERSGLACGRGVLVNGMLQTSAPDVYAAGDCIQMDMSKLHDAAGHCRIDDLNPGLWTYAKETGDIAGFNAVHPKDEGLSFVPKPEPVLFSALGTSLFAIGDVQEEDGVQVECSEPGEASGSLFLVNPHAGADPQYEKRFYRDDKLCGAVLIGDLSKMPEILDKMAEAPE